MDNWITFTVTAKKASFVLSFLGSAEIISHFLKSNPMTKEDVVPILYMIYHHNSVFQKEYMTNTVLCIACKKSGENMMLSDVSH